VAVLRLTRRRLLSYAALATLLLTLPGLPRGRLEVTTISWGLGVRIAFLPDLHVHRGGDRWYAVEALRSIRPDISIIGGDLWDGRTPSLEHVYGVVSEIVRASGRVVAVLGNHEHWASCCGISLRDAVRDLEDLGVYYLVDDKVQLGSVVVGGIDWREIPKLYTKPLSSVGEVDLLVAHSPDVFRHAARGQRLFLAGHTHGGQVCLPGAISIITNSVYGYKWGLYAEEGRLMYVSRGLGEKVLPRLYCGYELAVVS
jgi:hypothetical protein